MDNGIIGFILLITLATATMTDLLTGKISNWITVPITATGLVFHTVINGANGLIYSAKGLGTGFALLILLYVLGGLGAGDVKLVAASGSLLGPFGIMWAVCVTAMVGGLCALGLLVRRLGWAGMVQWIWSWLKTLVLLGGKPPALPSRENRLALRYAPIFALGTLVSLGMPYIEQR
jgi:prepilin peptidase CpaA